MSPGASVLRRAPALNLLPPYLYRDSSFTPKCCARRAHMRADMYQKEVRYLLAKLQEFDAGGEGRVTLDELYQALELATVYKVGQGRAGAARSPGRTGRSTAAVSFGAGTLGSTLGGSPGRGGAARQSAAAGLKEGFMRERVWQLEAELKSALDKEGMLEAEAKQVWGEMACCEWKLCRLGGGGWVGEGWTRRRCLMWRPSRGGGAAFEGDQQGGDHRHGRKASVGLSGDVTDRDAKYGRRKQGGNAQEPIIARK
eukprot:354921-Chlamydomonas_euryale.AAC.22